MLQEAIGQLDDLPRAGGTRIARAAPRAAANRRRARRLERGSASRRRSPGRCASSRRPTTARASRWRIGCARGRPGTACRFGEAAEASEQGRRACPPGRGRAPGAPRGTPPTPPQPHSARRSSTRRSRAASPASSRRSAIASRRATCSRCSGGLYATQGTFNRARELVARGRGLLEEIGLDVDAARAGIEAWRVEMLAGEYEAAERELRAALRGARGARRAVLPLHRLRADRPDAARARSLARRRRRAVPSQRELATDGRRRDAGALAAVAAGRSLARRGSLAEGEARCGRRSTCSRPTDATVLLLDAQLDLGEVLASPAATTRPARRTSGARPRTTKGGVVILGVVLRRLEELDPAPVDSSAQKS